MTLNLQKRHGKNGRFGRLIIFVRLTTSWWLRIFWSRACLLLGLLVNVNISAYLSGSSLIAMHMSWWEATIAIIAGNIIANILVVMNSLQGAYYHVGFPVVNRSVWGMWGTQFVIWNRIFLSIIWCTSIPSLTFYYLFSWKKIYWYCCDSWIPGLDRWWMRLHMSQGHMAFDRGADTKSHGSVHRCQTAQFLGYIIFMVISMSFIYIRPHKLQTLLYVSAIIVMVFMVVLLIWSMATMGPQGFGETITVSDGHTSGWDIAFGIGSTIGAISASLLNQNDYARFARKPSDAIQGQAIVYSPYAIFCCVSGILVTAATERRYGQAYWNLPNLFGAMIESGGPRSRCAAFFGGFALIISQIGITVPGNAFSGGKPRFLVWLKISLPCR